MRKKLKLGASWSNVEARLRLIYSEWAASRLDLARANEKSDYVQDSTLLGWSNRLSDLLRDVESPPSFAKRWSDGLSASDSAIRAHYLADLLRSGYTVESLFEKVTKHMEKELRLRSQIVEHTHEVLDKERHRILYRTRGLIERGGGRRIPNISFFLDQYEEILPQYGLPVRLEPMVEAALYSVYVALSPRSRVVVPRNRIELIRGLTIDDELLRVVSPRQFEELLFYLYEALGCRSVLSPATRDWGADLLAWQPGPFNTESLIVVQAKLYSPERKVSLAGVHALHGAVAHYNATTGHLVATAQLTGPAETFMDEEGYKFISTATLGEEVDSLLEKWTCT